MAHELASSHTGDDAFLQELYDLVGASVAAIDSVPAAVGLFTRAQGDPQRCALLAANLGGDTDTIGAIAGGMCGALSGFGAIPAELVRTLDDVNGMDLRPTAATLAGFRRRNAEGLAVA
jgi:ADP-ribosylglycohydrolase